MSQLFASDGQNTGVSASASVLPVSIQGWFPWRLTGLIPLQSKELSGVFSSTTVQKHQFFDTLPSLQSSSHSHTWPLGGRVLFNTLSRFVIAFMSRRCNIISCFASVSDLLHSAWQSLYHVVAPIFFASVCFSEHTSFCSIFPNSILIFHSHLSYILILLSRILSGIFFYFYINFEILNLSKTILPVLYKIE